MSFSFFQGLPVDVQEDIQAEERDLWMGSDPILNRPVVTDVEQSIRTESPMQINAPNNEAQEGSDSETDSTPEEDQFIVRYVS